MRSQPLFQRAQQRVVGQIRPTGIGAIDPAQKPDTCAPCLGLFAPRQRGKTGLANALEHRGGDQIGGRCRQSPFAQDKVAQPRLPPRHHRAFARTPTDDLVRNDAVGENLFDLGLAQRRSQEDARLALVAIEIGYGQIILGGQRVGGGQDRAAPVAQQELAVAPRTALGDAIGIGFGQDDARIVEITALIRGLDAPPPLLGLLPHLVQHGAVDREAGHFRYRAFRRR